MTCETHMTVYRRQRAGIKSLASSLRSHLMDKERDYWLLSATTAIHFSALSFLQCWHCSLWDTHGSQPGKTTNYLLMSSFVDTAQSGVIREKKAMTKQKPMVVVTGLAVARYLYLTDVICDAQPTVSKHWSPTDKQQTSTWNFIKHRTSNWP